MTNKAMIKKIAKFLNRLFQGRVNPSSTSGYHVEFDGVKYQISNMLLESEFEHLEEGLEIFMEEYHYSEAQRARIRNGNMLRAYRNHFSEHYEQEVEYAAERVLSSLFSNNPELDEDNIKKMKVIE